MPADIEQHSINLHIVKWYNIHTAFSDIKSIP